MNDKHHSALGISQSCYYDLGCVLPSTGGRPRRPSRTLLAVSVGLSLLFLLSACRSYEPLHANAGADFSVAMGEHPVFDGCGSTGRIVNYKWTVVTPCENVPQDAGKVLRETVDDCSFCLESAMGGEEVGIWIIGLEVRDPDGNTGTDTVRVTVMP